MKTILVTGGLGYIGSVVVPYLASSGYDVVVVDNNSVGSRGMVSVLSFADFRHLDLRDREATSKIVADTKPWAVVHLAAIVGDPAGKRDEALTRQTNFDATVSLSEVSSAHGAERFIFSSTCSNYGLTEEGELVNEESPLAPLSLYAKTKVEAELHLLSMQSEMARTILRFSTAHGLSPRMRFDLTVNEFARDAYLAREIDIFQGNTWRPYCHVRDFARAILACLRADRALIGGEVFNVGGSAQNYQKKTIAELAAGQSDEVVIREIENGSDARNYRVDFSKVKDRLGFEPAVSVPKSISEIVNALKADCFTNPMAMEWRNA